MSRLTFRGRNPAPRTLGVPLEPPAQRLRRHSQRAGLYARAALIIVALVILVVLIVANTDSVKVSWAFGSSHVPLVWVVIAVAVCGWLLGIMTAAIFRHRTRRRA